MAVDKRRDDSVAAAITEVSESLTRLVHDEIELAKTEVIGKATSLARGAVAIAAGAVFGVFALVFVGLTVAWAIDGILVSGVGEIWLGFLIVMAALVVLSGAAFLFAWKKLKVGPPTPKLALAEARKIRGTLRSSSQGRGPDA